MHLPRDSAFIREIDPDGTRWGETEHLIADMIDVLIAVNGGKQKWQRPGMQQAALARVEARAKRWEERVAERERAKAEREGAAT